ncbi:hypothetical protein FHR24_000954 [Wenyingzhuangia heitensis]|uniref:Lipoprotein n=1 Tax=Wenyingzhuangia heitensis TaxID=1487859 RepID=A0ABX0U9P2_9FLAO|nr:hypothetical protein [Wenyingzhuangia heitensis]NIJ44515.1 hypothetical protein [Wenyingzhuangia heitensis]
MKTFFKLLLINILLLASCKEEKKESPKTTITESVEHKEESFTTNKPSENTTIASKEHYICYNSDDIKDLKIWIKFNNNKATDVKYKRQKTSIALTYLKEEFIKGGAHPTIIKYYNEIIDDKLNGQYILTHSGIWDYVKYIRVKDHKEFKFTIDHNSNNYSDKPCF